MIKTLYIKCYQDRFKNREIRHQFTKLKALKERMFQIRLSKAKAVKSEYWSMDDLEKALKKLKNGKAPDPQGIIAELIKPENIGQDLKKSLLILMNRIKDELRDPEFLQVANIVSIYKGKSWF